MNDFITRPVKKQMLEKVIAAWLKKQGP